MYSLVLMKEKPNIDKFLSEVSHKERGVILLGDIYRVIEPCRSVKEGVYIDGVYTTLRSYIHYKLEFSEDKTFTYDDFPLDDEDLKRVNEIFGDGYKRDCIKSYVHGAPEIYELIQILMVDGEISGKGYYSIFDTEPLIDREELREKHNMWMYSCKY